MEPRLRDWQGTKGEAELILDADEPEEHEVLDGVYALDGVVCLKVHGRDLDDDERREILGTLLELMEREGETGFMAFVNDPANERGIGNEGLQVYEFRTDDGVWGVDGKWLEGKIEFAVVMSGVNRAAG